MPLSRRDLLAAFLGAPALLTTTGCGNARPPIPPGELIGASDGLGHRLRDRKKLPSPAGKPQQTQVAIIGAGVAGIAAARRLRQAGVKDLAILELEARAGGTARSDSSAVTKYPWGAHYVPAPTREFAALVDFFDELGAFEGRDERGDPIPVEHWAVRDPESRVFYKGRWYQGLALEEFFNDDDREQFQEFESEIDRWVAFRDEQGRRAFSIPMQQASDSEPLRELDRIDMAAWLKSKGLDSQRLRWYVDYACRDDYGLNAEQTSAWATLFYFAARKVAPGGPSRPFLTWPEGNGYLIQRMAEPLRKQLLLGQAAARVEQLEDGGVEVHCVSASGDCRVWRAEAVVFAAPRFLAPYVITGYADERGDEARAFQYGAWAVVNLHLRQRPEERGFPLCWDNVLYESQSLGYVVATHQRGPEHGPTVLTYYYPLNDDDPRAARRRILDVGREGWADIALTDLEAAHPDIRQLTERADVMRWGHAMILPTPGFIFGKARTAALRSFGGIHFAHSDMSGLPLFEEAFYRGVSAAEGVLNQLGVASESVL